MKGLVGEGQEMMEEGMEGAILDSALTGAARKVEHYEMMGYESARSLTQQCGCRDAAQLLRETMRGEMEADRTLAQISKRLLKESGGRGRQKAPTASLLRDRPDLPGDRPARAVGRGL